MPKLEDKFSHMEILIIIVLRSLLRKNWSKATIKADKARFSPRFNYQCQLLMTKVDKKACKINQKTKFQKTIVIGAKTKISGCRMPNKLCLSLPLGSIGSSRLTSSPLLRPPHSILETCSYPIRSRKRQSKLKLKSPRWNKLVYFQLPEKNLWKDSTFWYRLLLTKRKRER